jgi:hypothetical protein
VSLDESRAHPGAPDGDGVDLSDPPAPATPQTGETARDGDPRSVRNDNIVRLTAQGWSRDSLAEFMNVSPRTIDRVRSANRDAIQTLRDEHMEQTSAALNALVPKAVRRLHVLIDSPLESVSLGAAKFVVDAALRYRDAADTEKRVRALEEGVIADGEWSPPWTS